MRFHNIHMIVAFLVLSIFTASTSATPAPSVAPSLPPTSSRQPLANELIQSGDWSGDQTCSGATPQVFIQVFGIGQVDWVNTELQIVRGALSDFFNPFSNQSLCSTDDFNFIFFKAFFGFPAGGEVVVIANGVYETTLTSADFAVDDFATWNILATRQANLPFTRAPSAAPSVSPSAAPTPSPIAAPTITCNYPDQRLDIQISPDSKPEETSWDLFEVVGNQASVIAEEKSATGRSVCLTPGDYAFNIIDCGGDGLCCAFGMGSYSLTLDDVMVKSGGEFLHAEPFRFSISAGSAAPTALTNMVCAGNGQTLLDVEIVPDNSPEEISWQLLLLAAGGNSVILDMTASFKTCINAGNYIWSIEDTGNNGICCGNGMGSFTVTVGDTVVHTGGQFGSFDFVDFTV